MKISIVIAACCFSLSGFAQKGDHLVKNNGDTIWGTAKLKEGNFYIANQQVRADDVNKIKSEYYKGNTVVRCQLQLYADNIDALELDYIQRGTVDTVLVLDEIYTTPKMNLYFVRNDFKIPFYFYKTPNDPKPLQLVIRYYLEGGLGNYNLDRARYAGMKSKVMIVEDKGYVNQLQSIMRNCKNIPPTMWEMLSYRDYSIKAVIKRYNKCK